MTISDKGSEIPSIQSSLIFSKLLGNEELKILLILLAIDPTINGLIVFGSTGTGKSQFLRTFSELKIPVKKIVDCPYNCTTSSLLLCQECNNILVTKRDINIQDSYLPVVSMPPTVPLDSIVGNLDINLNFKPGFLAKVNNGYLIIDDFHLMAQQTRRVVLNIWQKKINEIHREGISTSHPSNFCLLASANLDIHDISHAILDKFAFSYNLTYEKTVPQRLSILELNLENKIHSLNENDFNKDNFVTLQQTIVEAKQNLSTITFSRESLELISEICSKSEVQGLRADISLALGARALASFLGRQTVIKEDILFLVPFILRHRLPNEKTDGMNELVSGYLNSHVKKRRSSKKVKEINRMPQIKEKPKRSTSYVERFATALGFFVISFSFTLIIVNLFGNPSLFFNIFGVIIIWGMATIFLSQWIRSRRRLIEKNGFNADLKEEKPDLSSFGKVKQYKLTNKTKEEKREFQKEVILDLEEDRSRKGKLLRFVGFTRRKGLISLSVRQRFWLTIMGTIFLLISLILYTVFILYLPLEVWPFIILFSLSILTIRYIAQDSRKEWRIRRVADVGASPQEKSKNLKEKGIGSYISPIESSNISSEAPDLYTNKLMDKLVELNVIHEKESKETFKVNLFSITTKGELKQNSLKVVADNLPARTQIDTKVRSRIGKRAQSLTSLQTGRIIGHKPFKDYPRNIHILATIRNALIRNYRENILKSKQGISVKLADIREKALCTRVSASIIFVLDLSESITSVKNVVSSSVKWLSRQAYLYRDRVGVVILKGTQGVVIQPPTSNLNLIKRKLRELHVSGSTPLAGGLQKAIELIKLDRVRSKNEVIPIIILITDGAANIPLLADPITGITRNLPLKDLGIDHAVVMAIEDCLTLAHQIKNEKISLIIFSTNITGGKQLARILGGEDQRKLNFLKTLLVQHKMFGDQKFIQLWSYLLLRSMQEISNGYYYNLSITRSIDLNLETLRIARAEILSNIMDEH